MVKASHHQVSYNWLIRDTNLAGSEKAAELKLPLNTPIDEYEAVLAMAPHLLLVHSLPDMPMPETGLEVEDVTEEVPIKQEKDTASPSRHKLVIPQLPRGQFDRPSKCPYFDDSDLDDIMTQHFHAGTIVVPLTKMLKSCSLKGKAHAQGSFKAMTVKLEPVSALPATIEPSAASMQLERMMSYRSSSLRRIGP
ncbi:uncharacterized protein LAESUDRAFT_765473 [Laetiporus sulphureus 93-53]|uniref:Uncharacterized protein n=1 Tax=Laetiporus sulphureus 93-53 TaxID=1314785 RepID=A0A165AQZ5_9APHY|nr:uncharacterized protein LAESUDRAFT_765473 [Laetiporus sulphureus 93-53]KZS99486.1 hypothetical protein LAESUDRAFT_765473 [Laetiporus sulphureus 93-53]